MIAILAGNHQQFREFIFENDLDTKDFKYIDSSIPLAGYRFTGYKIIGTFYEDQKNAFEMLDEVKIRLNLPTQPQQ